MMDVMMRYTLSSGEHYPELDVGVDSVYLYNGEYIESFQIGDILRDALIEVMRLWNEFDTMVLQADVWTQKHVNEEEFRQRTGDMDRLLSNQKALGKFITRWGKTLFNEADECLEILRNSEIAQ